MPSEKLLSRAEAARRAAEVRREGKTIVTVNGAFDLLHAGHLAILEEAKAQGEVLFVGLNSDVSVRQYKGPARPIVDEQHRARMLLALTSVDYVVLIDEPEAGAAIIDLCRPHVHVNGAEYGPPEQWVEYPALQRHGVRGHVCSREPGLSTSELIAKISQLARAERGARLSKGA